MVKIKFSTGEVYEGAEAISVYDAAASLGIVVREHITCRLDGELRELSAIVDGEAEVTLLTFKDEDGKHVFRHTAAHVMAQAVKRLFPSTKQTIGPATDTGYFQDFDAEVSFTPEVLKDIEAEMKKIVKENLLIKREELSKEDALKLMTELDEPYKVDRINELPEDAVISIYRQGEYVDLCACPHLRSSSMVKAF